MRLVCPNCAAQYDVDDRVIPPAGREVQCSNCGHSWFQPPAGAETAAQPPAETAKPAVSAPGGAPEAPDAATAAAEIGDEPEASAEAEAGAGTDAAAAGRRLPQPEEDAAWEDDEPADHLPAAATGAAEPAAAPAQAETETGTDTWHGADQNRRARDEAVLAILREEAEREARARKAEAERGMEEQGDLGLPPPAPVPRRPEPPVEPAAEPAEPAETATAAPEPAEATALPDAGEITATLNAPETPAPEPEVTPSPATTGRSGFRAGFALMLALGLLALAGYVLAPALSGMAPGLAGPLADYVAGVNELRFWLDATLRGLVAGDGGG